MGRYANEIEDELRRWLQVREPIGRHYDLLCYHMGWLDEAFEASARAGGKRFRPLLCLLSCEAVGADRKDALPVAAAIEFLHNFSLIHDDIEDHDETRHHRPALWALSGEPLAINAGDAMLALSGLAALSAVQAPEISRKLHETALALTEGQYLDMSFEDRVDVSVDEYRTMIRLKTGALITYSCEAGGVLGGGSESQIEALRRFGEHFGLAFQIYDDILGVWAPSARTGKPQAKDIANRKKSLPVVLALERASGEDGKVLHSYYRGSNEVSTDEVVSIIDRLQIRDDVERRLQSHLDKAGQALDSAELEQPYRGDLARVAAWLVDVTNLPATA